MRIRLPERIPVQKSLLFCGALALAQLAEGTGPLYTLLVFLFLMGSVFAFNVAGGLTRPSGAYIFFYSALTVGVGTVYKAMLGMAADTHMEAPVLTISIYTVSVGGMLVAAFLTRKIVNSRDGFAGLIRVPDVDFGASAIGCIAVVFLIDGAFAIFPGGAGSLLHAISMVNYFLPLGILLGTIATVRSSGGRHSTSPLTLCVFAYAMYYGLLSFSKQAMLTPFTCWLLGVAWARFRLQPKHLIGIVAFCVLAQEFLVPLANVGHVDGVNKPRPQQLALVEMYLEHPRKLKQVNDDRTEAYAGIGDWYFGEPKGLMDRLTMLAVDSQLISFTAQGHYFGYLPVLVYFQNWVPHAVNPHKLENVLVGGNRYAHEMGQLADSDTTTGISYSPSAEAFHLDGWTGILLLQPCIFLLVFITTDLVCGDLRYQPWGLVPMLLFAHVAPEELLNGSIEFVWLGNIGVMFCIFVSGYVTPIFGHLLRGRQRVPAWRAEMAIARAYRRADT